MAGAELVRLDAAQPPALLQPGTTVLGRGPLLGIAATSVSRQQASLTVAQTGHRASITGTHRYYLVRIFLDLVMRIKV